MTLTNTPPPPSASGDPPVEPPAGTEPPSGRGPGALWHRFTHQPVEGWFTLAVVGACVAFVVVHLAPGQWFADTTPAGGDMGAHVWGPAFLRDELLPRFRLTGWSPDWYAGLPALHFYMVPAMLAIALASFVLPYGVAFTLVAVSGVVTMPVSAWVFGRLARLPFPMPALMAVGATAFLFDRSFSIYGGNLASTLAGEFAFSISLSLALVYLGVVARGLRTGRHRALAAALLALVFLNHVIPGIFAVFATVALALVYPGSTGAWRWRARAAAVPALLGAVLLVVVAVLPVVPGGARGVVAVLLGGVVAVSVLAWLGMATGADRWVWLTGTGLIGGLLTAWWTWPFWSQRAYLNDMGWERKTNIATLLWDRGTTVAGRGLDSGLVDAPPLQFVIGLAAVGLILSVAGRHRAGVALAVIAVVAALAVWGLPQGRLWNARVTPFYYLALYLLAAIGIAGFGRLLAQLVARDVTRPVRGVQWLTAVVGALVVLGALALPLRSLPFGRLDGDTYRWGPFATTDRSFIPGWASWNFSGYENKEAWPEYQDLMATMAAVGAERGCGRAMWEYSGDLDRYGTPMALMLLPFWTEGCIGSMEGLYFETSATTPYHFLNQDKLSESPSNAQRDLPYRPSPPTPELFTQGVTDLGLFGVRYFMAESDRITDLANDDDRLEVVARSGPWTIYEVADSALVTGLANRPVVVEGADAGGEHWLELSVAWFDDPERRDVLWAANGPPDWQRIPDVPPAEIDAAVEAVEEPPVRVSDIDAGVDRLSFTVDRTGVPVLVRTSFFPNWRASGAQGPWRVTPNLMVVIPTDQQVELTYGTSGPEVVGLTATGVGLEALVAWWWWGRRRTVTPVWWLWASRAHPDPRDPRVPPADPPGPLAGPAERAEDRQWDDPLADSAPETPNVPADRSGAAPGGEPGANPDGDFWSRGGSQRPGESW